MHRSLTALLITAVAVGCSGIDDGPSAVTLETSPFFAVGDRVHEQIQVIPGVVNVCAFALEETTGLTAEVSANATAGDFASFFTIGDSPHCFEAWNSTSGSAATFSATLTAAYAGAEHFAATQVFTFVGDGVTAPTINDYSNVQSASINVSDVMGGHIWFTLELTDGPDDNGGGAG
jgi:hypothetical protein